MFYLLYFFPINLFRKISFGRFSKTLVCLFCFPRTIMSTSKTITDLCSGRVTDTWNIGANFFQSQFFQNPKWSSPRLFWKFCDITRKMNDTSFSKFLSTKHNTGINFQVWVKINLCLLTTVPWGQIWKGQIWYMWGNYQRVKIKKK